MADRTKHAAACGVDSEGKAARRCLVVVSATLVENPDMARLILETPTREGRVPTISVPGVDIAHAFWDLAAAEKTRFVTDALFLADLLDMALQETNVHDNFVWAKKYLAEATELTTEDDADEPLDLQRAIRLAQMLDKLAAHATIGVSFTHPIALSIVSPRAGDLLAAHEDIGRGSFVYIQALEYDSESHPRILQAAMLGPDVLGGPCSTKMLDVRSGEFVPAGAAMDA